MIIGYAAETNFGLIDLNQHQRKWHKYEERKGSVWLLTEGTGVGAHHCHWIHILRQPPCHLPHLVLLFPTLADALPAPAALMGFTDSQYGHQQSTSYSTGSYFMPTDAFCHKYMQLWNWGKYKPSKMQQLELCRSIAHSVITGKHHD